MGIIISDFVNFIGKQRNPVVFNLCFKITSEVKHLFYYWPFEYSFVSCLLMFSQFSSIEVLFFS